MKIMATKKLIEDFEAFREHCIDIRNNYNTHNALYSSEAIKLLDKTARSFFSELSEIMVKYWILRVCAIMDSAEIEARDGKKHENITIELINKQLKSEGLRTRNTRRLSNELREYGIKLKPARDKLIAHNDREHWFKDITLGATTKEELDAFLVNLQDYCDEVALALKEVGHALGKEIGPADFSCSPCDGDVIDFLRVLRKYHKSDSEK